MTMDNLRTRERIVELAGQFLDAMRRGEWKEATVLQKQRDSAIRYLCEHVGLGEANALSSLLREMQGVNEEARRLGSRAREQVLGDLEALKENKRGHLAYQRRRAA